jgi:hypothetical protein
MLGRPMLALSRSLGRLELYASVVHSQSRNASAPSTLHVNDKH